MVFNSINQIIADKLLQINAINLNVSQPYIWASGIISPIYCDNRLSLSYPEIRSLICQSFAELAAEIPFDTIAGVATGGIAHGVLLAQALNKPFVYVRSVAKGHGLKNAVEGKLDPGDHVLVVEDLVSTGGSSLQAVDALREAGATVTDMLAIVTYGFSKAIDAFQNSAVQLQTLTDYTAIVKQAIDTGRISADMEQSLAAWRSDPEAWNK